ncbi:MAG: class I SAM-dependent methyltransferase [Bdellovibrionales bacterium]|nr:class I SAM-dependent methyltransferase [Bdellovibrionales bacterium]
MNVTKRVHRPALYGLVEALSQCFNQGHYADKVLQRHFFQNRKMGARDRKFFAESFYETVRWWRRLRYSTGLVDLPQLGHYRDQDFKLALSAWCLLNGYNIESFRAEGFLGDTNRVRSLWDSPGSSAVKESFPDWLWARGIQELGDKWEKLACDSNQPAPLYLRVNGLRSRPKELQLRLREEGIEAQLVSEGPDALLVVEKSNVFSTNAFKQGLFEVQDLGSQMISPFVQVEPGMRVIDACAGAGGKSLHLASLMRNKGKILALDIHEWKLGELRVRARRAGINTIETKLIRSSKTIKRLHGQVDRVLLDVPCSGLGVMRRNPDVKWKLSEAECERLNELQAEILGRYSPMVKVRGKLVYATCSIFPSENQMQVRRFLESHPNWELEAEFQRMPTPQGSDGFYGARLLRNQR